MPTFTDRHIAPDRALGQVCLSLVFVINKITNACILSHKVKSKHQHSQPQDEKFTFKLWMHIQWSK